jgi:cobalt/nickel transport system permease protein
MISIDKVAYTSRLMNRDPVQKLLFAVLTLAVCLWADNGLISILVILIMGGTTVFKGGTPLRFFVKLMFVPMAFLVVSVLTIAINISGDRDAFLAAIPVAKVWIGLSATGIQYAARLVLRALGAVSCLYYLSLTTPMTGLLAALSRLKLPKLFGELMELIYRSIFILLEEAEAIYNAQSCRLGYSGFSASFRSLGELGSMLFIRSYKRSNELYTSLESRGYEGELDMLEEEYEGGWSGYAIPAAVNLLLIALGILLKSSTGGVV